MKLSNDVSTSGSIVVSGGNSYYLKTDYSKTPVLTAAGGITLNSDRYWWLGYNPTLNTNGVTIIQSNGSSFASSINTN